MDALHLIYILQGGTILRFTPPVFVFKVYIQKACLATKMHVNVLFDAEINHYKLQ